MTAIKESGKSLSDGGSVVLVAIGGFFAGVGRNRFDACYYPYFGKIVNMLSTNVIYKTY
jgi:hypothetical protein